ncbi:MAG: TetR/AcrR family transcriptional regulator [Deltaproteobacteria bacterium]|nr:TetR/AcrR family transcriptional regulator [Deltaproteobacteria bacterium]
MGGKLPKESDRRVQRTRRTLREALVTMVLEKGWEGFSVQDVCDRADVGRSTFYTHFADKEDLLIGGLDDLRKGLRALAAKERSGTPLGFARGLIEHAAEQQRLFRAVVGKRSGQVVQQKFRSVVLGLVQEDLAAHAPAGPRRDAAAHYFTGALLEVLTWWLETHHALGAAEVEQLFQEMARPTLEVLAPRR